MAETMQRYLNNLSENTNTDENKAQWLMPDLIVIDGGKGQLNRACKILR